MSAKRKRNRLVVESLDLNPGRRPDEITEPTAPETESRLSFAGRSVLYARRHRIILGSIPLVLLLGLGIFASNGWLPRTDAMTGQRTGWFGSKSSPPSKGGVDALRGRGGLSGAEPQGGLNAASTDGVVGRNSLDPQPAMPSSTPQLSKEYVYAGSRLLAVEDANASAVPPADLAVWRPSNGYWYVFGGPGSQQTIYGFGQRDDIPLQGDFDGDGKTDFAAFRPDDTTWYIVYSSTQSLFQMSYGNSDDVPAVADYDGDGRSDIAVYRASNGTWYIYQSSTLATNTFQYSYVGQAGDQVSPADYDGDGKADPGLWSPGSPGTFYIRKSSDGQTQALNLASTGQPVSCDYDGDGKADFAVLSGNVWTIRSSITGINSTTTWESSGDIPVQNDYDGDGKCDIAVWRSSNGNWYIRKSGSSNALRQEHWGTSGDIPVPAYYRR